MSTPASSTAADPSAAATTADPSATTAVGPPGDTAVPPTADAQATAPGATRRRRSSAPDRRLAPGGPGLLGGDRRADRPAQPDLLGLLRAHRLLDLEPVVGAGAVPRARSTASTRPASSC